MCIFSVCVCVQGGENSFLQTRKTSVVQVQFSHKSRSPPVVPLNAIANSDEFNHIPFRQTPRACCRKLVRNKTVADKKGDCAWAASPNDDYRCVLLLPYQDRGWSDYEPLCQNRCFGIISRTNKPIPFAWILIVLFMFLVVLLWRNASILY